MKLLALPASLLMCLCFITLPNPAHSEQATYSVTDESWSPYWIIDKKQVSGILSDIMLNLDSHLDVKLQANKPLPVKRAQKWFKKGDLQIECCVNEAWRSAPEQAEVSLWTDPVITAEEVLIFPKGESFAFSKLEDLTGKSIATVRGYGYVGSEFFKRSDSKDNITQIKKVAAGRVDAGIIDRFELAYMLKTNAELKEAAPKLEQGPVINRSELKMRVHTSRPELVSPINEALAKIKSAGATQKIVDSYIK